MFRLLLFTMALTAVQAGATCGDDLSTLTSRTDSRYSSGFTAPAPNSLGFSHLVMNNARRLREKRLGFESAPLPEVVGWLHEQSYAESVITRQARRTNDEGVLDMMELGAKNLTPLVTGAISRIMTFDDEQLAPVFDELVTIAADLTTTHVRFRATLPLMERLVELAASRGDWTRRLALIDYLTRFYVGQAEDRPKFLQYLPLWLERFSAPEDRLNVMAQVIRKQIAVGGKYPPGYFRTMVDFLPRIWDMNLRYEDPSFVIDALDKLKLYGNRELTPGQNARLALLRETFAN